MGSPDSRTTSDISFELQPCLEVLESSMCDWVGRMVVISPAGVLIGRSPDAELHLEDDSLSREHARIELRPDGVAVLVDLDSTNGTYLNGARVDRAPLSLGDRIRIGHTLIQYGNDSLRSSQRVNELLATAHIALWEWEPQTGRFSASNNFGEVTGVSVQEMTARPVAALELVHTEDRERLTTALRALRASTESVELDLRLRGSGSYDVWLTVRAHPVRAGQSLTITGSATNTTVRKRAERELRRVTRVLENLHDAIVVTDLDGRITDWTAKAEAVFQRRKDGVPPAQLSELIGDKRVGEIQRAISEHGHWTAEIPIILSGELEGLFEVATAPLKDEDGWVVGYVAALRDVTERKALQNQLILADKLAAIGSLAAGVAHEINNPLAVVTGGLEWIGERLMKQLQPLSGTAHEVATLNDVLAEMRDGVTRIAGIVAGMKNASQKDDPSSANQVLLLRAIEGAARILANEIRHSARLVITVPDDLWVSCSETRLMQVFIHLIANAAHAIEERNGGFNEIRIEVSERGADRASVTVRDTGVGMSPDTLGRLFTPFFSTKQAGRGTGLGLSVSRTIIDACGGRIHFESQAGQGTTATVELPVAPAPPAPPVAPESSGERGRILVIDDEPFVANALCRLLRSRGFQTDAATDGRAGRDKLLTGEYQAVLCDLMMPEYSGVDFYNDIEARRPDLVRRIIFLSGGAFTPTAEAFIEEGRRPVLPKPWSVKILISAIDDIE